MENASLSFDKRKHPRIKVNIPVKYKVINQTEEAMALLEHKRSPMDASSVDVSAEGLCLLTPHELSRGDILKIEVNLPSESQALRAFSEVVWTTPQEQGSHAAGIFFMALREEDADKIKRFVETTLAASGE
ncbi:MAG: PilZ domain-containing protein [Candidatus Firestonebacteria bacterium]|nr:PilZ domain-containing protein [Candidatus Firestonebacteria bacterium]